MVGRPLHSISLSGCKLQVITKLASIELTPEKPHYDGGAWHVEGMEDEKIVATAIYYVASENVTETQLEFRHAVCERFGYEQNEHDAPRYYYGIVNGDDDFSINQPENGAHQHLGCCSTPERRALAWPNPRPRAPGSGSGA